MSKWLEFYYIGLTPLLPHAQIDSSVLSIGYLEDSRDYLEPPSGEPITIKDLDDGMQCLELFGSLEQAQRDYSQARVLRAFLSGQIEMI